MYCSKCGANVTDGAAFCSACGQPAGAAAAVRSAPLSSAANAIGAPAYPAPGSVSPYTAPPLPVISPSPYAGFWLRVVAHLIDGLLLGIGFGILALICVGIVGVEHFRAMFEGMNSDDPSATLAFISAISFLIVGSLVLAWIYYAWMESSVHQGTLGKMALGLTVTDLQGRPISFARASGRYFAKMITGMIPLGIGYAMAGFTEKKQALQDMIAGCLVLRRT
jgi:uncharacterized RDD family membrane protein YckC